jgi:YegS/Rv2252/BmrU family lipid kinase
MSRRVKLIFNPHADRGRAWDLASSLQAIIERHGGASWAASEYPTHATELAEQAALDSFDVVAALGGDGTVHEVVNGLMRVPPDQMPILGIVPLGSGNDFSSSVGVQKDIELAMDRVFHGAPKAIDLGEVIDNSGRTEYWDNTLGIGFDASATIHSYKITQLQGFALYLWAVILTILKNHDAPLMKIVTDEETIEQEVLMFVMCNGPREGGGFFVAPDAKPDDGILHYAMIEHVSRPMMFRLVPEVMNGTHGRFKQVRMGQFRELRLTSERPITIHTDGEVFAGFHSDVTEIDVKIHPGVLNVIV